jgi:phosphoglycolate phosphatase
MGIAGVDVAIFDLDGTLVDSLPDLTDAVNHFLLATGRTPLSMEGVRKLVGQGAKYLVERALDDAGPEEVANCLRLFIAYNEEHLVEKTRLYPGVVETLAELQRQGVRLALVSNKVEALCRKLLTLLQIEGYFHLVLGGDSLPNRKPSPDPLLKVLHDLGVSPERALMVGDSINDIAAGKGAGIKTVGCSFGYGEPEEVIQADFVINELPALLNLPILK